MFLCAAAAIAIFSDTAGAQETDTARNLREIRKEK
jgi:hypothetical protein